MGADHIGGGPKSLRKSSISPFRDPASTSEIGDSIYTSYQLPGLMPAGTLRSTIHGMASVDFISMKNL